MVFEIIKTADVNADDLKECFYSLCEEEKQRILSKTKLELQKNSLVGMYAVKKGLKEHFGIENPQILRQKNGKPYLKGNEIFFSISHTADTLAVAFSLHPVGIDIEYPRECSPLVCKRMFTESEKIYAEQSNINFTRIWTLKEAAVKAMGEGIADAQKYSFVLYGEELRSNIDNAHITQKTKNDLIISIFELK